MIGLRLALQPAPMEGGMLRSYLESADGEWVTLADLMRAVQSVSDVSPAVLTLGPTIGEAAIVLTLRQHAAERAAAVKRAEDAEAERAAREAADAHDARFADTLPAAERMEPGRPMFASETTSVVHAAGESIVRGEDGTALRVTLCGRQAPNGSPAPGREINCTRCVRIRARKTFGR